MKVKTKYICEICQQEYDNEKEARNCESKGVPPLLPIGTIYQTPQYKDIVFAIMKCLPRAYGHHHAYSTSACRDNDAGDNKKDEYCGAESWNHFIPPDTKLPAYRRMVKLLKEWGIVPIKYKSD